MSATHENPSPAGGPSPDPGPAVNRDQIHNLDQLRLSSDDRYIAGVAGGLGRHFGIDPIVVRVVLAALCVFSGIGFLIYGVLWIFVPSDRTNRAIVDLNGPTRRTVLLIFGTIAALGAIGSVVGGFGGFGGHFAWPLAAVVAACAVALAYLRPENYRAHRNGDAVQPPTEDDRPPATTPPAPPTAAWMPPPTPHRPRRTGLILFWPTVATILVAFGILGIIAADHTLAPLWWPGTALAIVGIALVIGAFIGRPGGLILLGFLLMPPVIATTVLGGGGWAHQDLNAPISSAADLASTYTIGTGSATLNLSGVADPNALAGRTVTVTMKAGQITVTLPAGVQSQVDASLAIAGDVHVGDTERSGFEPSVHTTVGPGATPPLHLILKGRVGSIQVNTK